MTTTNRAAAVAALEQRLGHAFVDRELLERALTHASVGQGSTKIPDNERLEFLGDRVLGLVVARELMKLDETATSGDLSKRLHGLVDGRTCARVARQIGLGAALRMPPAETRRGARDSDRILGDACEALIAALFLDAGLERATQIVLANWRGLIDAPFDASAINPKSRLQEWALAQGLALPSYSLVSREGPDHAPLFTVEVVVAGYEPVSAVGATLRAAESAAAGALLAREGGAP
jgi:ribonuclease-3